jgi:hypothetical protein
MVMLGSKYLAFVEDVWHMLVMTSSSKLNASLVSYTPSRYQHTAEHLKPCEVASRTVCIGSLSRDLRPCCF